MEVFAFYKYTTELGYAQTSAQNAQILQILQIAQLQNFNCALSDFFLLAQFTFALSRSFFLLRNLHLRFQGLFFRLRNLHLRIVYLKFKFSLKCATAKPGYLSKNK